MPLRSTGRSSGVNGVRTATIPQPMSTPTAAGMIAPSVGMHDPTIAPIPTWQSGMIATCLKMNGMEARFTICCIAAGSICSGGIQDMAVSLIRYMVLLLHKNLLIHDGRQTKRP